MKLLSVVVTYYPDEELLKNNVNAFINHVDKVLIWENTPQEEKNSYRFVEHPKVEYCGDGINSISHALNYSWHYAQEQGYDYLLTMDQDSVWGDFQYYKNQIASLKDNKNSIYCPHVTMNPIPSLPVDEVDYGITSGMMVPVKVLNNIGGYNEDFRIDGIDLDLCLKARLYGIKTFVIRDAVLNQRYGEPLIKEVFGKSVYVTSYSPTRLYGIYKNHIILLRRYKKMSNELKTRIKNKYFYLTPRNIVLFEKNKCSKIISIIKGIYSGVTYKL